MKKKQPALAPFLVNKREAARLMGVSVSTFERLGIRARYLREGGRPMYMVDDLKLFVMTSVSRGGGFRRRKSA